MRFWVGFRRSLVSLSLLLGLLSIWRRAPELLESSRAILTLKDGSLFLEARLASSRILEGQDEVIPVRLLLDARQPPSQAKERPSLNLAIVLDRSGSMEEEGRMEQVKRTLRSLFDRLSPTDRVALVSYATGVKVHFSGPLDREALSEALDELQPMGGTNLYDGLETGCREMEPGLGAGISRILLFSDGIANIGVREPSQIVEKLRPCLTRGVTLSAIGVGSDYNEDLLTELAERGRGNYYVIESPSAIAAALDREMRELNSVVAREGELHLELPEGVELERVYGYEHTMQGHSVVIQMKDLAAGEQRKVLVELRVRGKASKHQPVVRPCLYYKGGKLEAKEALALEPAKTQQEVNASLDEEVNAEVVYTRNSLALEEASQLVEQGQAAAAELQLTNAAHLSRKGAGQNARLQKQAGELEQSLQWVQSGARDERSQKMAIKKMKCQARAYTKE